MTMKSCIAAILVSLAMGLLVEPVLATQPGPDPRTDRYQLIRSYPHDPAAFTQGLAYENGKLYESTGLYGASSLRVVDLNTGAVDKISRLHPRLFGEGLTVFGDRIIQLTWKSRLGLVFDKSTLKLQRTFKYPMEGWGLTHDGRHLIMSDGSATLTFLDPENFQEIRRILVRDRGQPITQLNELEYIRGEIGQCLEVHPHRPNFAGDRKYHRLDRTFRPGQGRSCPGKPRCTTLRTERYRLRP